MILKYIMNAVKFNNIMFIDRLQVHNNTMVKKYNILGTHTHYIYTVMLKCNNVQIYIKNGDNPNKYVHLIYVKNITPAMFSFFMDVTVLSSHIEL